VARRFTYLLLWLALTAEISGFVFNGLWETPLTTIGTAIFNGLPIIHVFPWDMALVATLAAGMASRVWKTNRVEPLLSSIKISLLSIAASWVWGVLRSGDAYQSMFQLRALVIQRLIACLVLATCSTMGHMKSLGNVIVIAAVYRSFVVMAFWFFVVRFMDEPPHQLTDHADSVLFSIGLLLLVIYAAEKRSSSAITAAIVGAIPICTAIVLNNRRIAWLDLGVGLLVAYILLPKDKFKRKLNRTLLALSPVFAIYVAIGWGHSTGIFTPVGSISGMFGSTEDTSSIMRDIENYNLTKTLATNPVLGTGWGHEYNELVVAINIGGAFPQYRFLPHNSLLGALAFSGMIGFAGLWQVVPVAAFLHARASNAVRGPIPHTAATAGLAILVVGSMQAWGDLGLDALTVNVLMGISIGVAGRLPVLVGAWPAAPGSKSRKNV
jgi:hypothetical protein